jgi:hypothetical protein
MNRPSFAEIAARFELNSDRCCVVIYSSDDMLIGIVDLIRANEEYYSPQFQAACEMERFEVGGDDDQQPYWTSDLREAYIEAMRRLDALLDR